MSVQSSNQIDFTPEKGELFDRVALITGAASGIGFAISKRLLDEGARIAMLDINQDALDEKRNELSRDENETRVITIKCDITKEDDVISAVEEIVEHLDS
jgi:NAD(P)-dependent dehydrogenase (short-subunit alcohol dehydrogenase family)